MPDKISTHYQTVTLELADGRRVSYTGRAQLDVMAPTAVVGVVFSVPEPLPKGMTWDTMPVQETKEILEAKCQKNG